jgi:hypothetical protein
MDGTCLFRLGSVPQSASCGLYYKSFEIITYDRNDSAVVIYDCNDSCQYYKTMIIANLALGKNVNYDRKVPLSVPFTIMRSYVLPIGAYQCL